MCSILAADHGHDNRLPNMHPFFIAHGPAFKKGLKGAAPFNSVDIYPMVCHILGLHRDTWAENDGNLANVEHILADEHSNDMMTIVTCKFCVQCGSHFVPRVS